MSSKKKKPNQVQQLKRRVQMLAHFFVLASNSWARDQAYGSEAIRVEKEDDAAIAKLTRMKLTKRERTWAKKHVGEQYLDQLDRG